MAEAKNSFIKSKMNKDLDARLLPRGEYREGFNIQVSKSEGADVGALENVLGNTELVDLKTKSGCNCDLTTIGLYTDEVNNNIYIFLTDYTETASGDYNVQLLNYSTSANNYIYLYNTASRESTILATGSFLNFSTTHPVTSINLLEGILFWTDNRNQPRKINVQSAITFSPDYYISEDQITVATYAPFQPIELYQRRQGAFVVDPTVSSTFSWNNNIVPVWPNGGSAVVVVDPANIKNKAGQNAILLEAADRFGLAKELDIEKTLIGSLVTAVDATGAAISPAPIPVNTALQSFSNGNEIALCDRTALPGVETPVNLAQDIAPGTIIYFNQNLNPITLGSLGNDNWVTSMENASSPMNPGGDYDEDYPGLTTNPNYNPKFNGDPDFLEDKFVRFSYRFKFEGGNYSIMAPFTQAAFIPKQDGYFLGETTPVSMTTDEQATYRSTVVGFMENKVNNIFLQIPLPLDKDNNGIEAKNLFNELKIAEIEILYKESDGLAIRVVDTIPRVGEQGYERFDTETTIEYNYQGNKPYKTLPNSEITRVYDKAPVRAFTQEIISNRLVYGNFQNKHTPPETLDYNVAVSDKYEEFAADDPTIPRPIERTVSREYPMHTVKQNRNYQIGVVLSDRYGRSSTTILSSVSTQATGDDDLTLVGDTIYFPYNKVSSATKTQNLIQKWLGDSIKVLFNTPIKENVPHNLTTGWPGLYNGDSTVTEYNPLGWYSYKIVVKQTEQEYYNVYLPGIMNFYPPVAADPDVAQSVSYITLLNDNINKVPRDLTEVGPEQKQFRSSVQLFGRVAPGQIAQPINNYQFDPVNAATRIALSDTVSTISEQNSLFDNTTNVKYGSIYQTISNPSMARIALSGNEIGSIAPASDTTLVNTWLSVYETEPVESKIDIYWETSSTGTIAELNEAIKAGSGGIKNFTTGDHLSIQNSKWTFNLAEDVTPGDFITASYSNGTYTSVPFFPYTEDPSGVKVAVMDSEIDLTSGFWVVNGNGEDVTSKFTLTRTAGSGTPDTYKISISNNTFFYYGPNSYIEDSFTFNFNVQNNDAGTQQGIITQIALTEKLLNVAPSIICPSDGIVVEPGVSPVYSFEGINGSQNNSKNQEDLSWSITSQDPLDPDNGIPELIIDSTTGVVTDPSNALTTPVALTIALTDAGTVDTTISNSGGAGGDPIGTCAPDVTGNLGYKTFALNDSFGSVKNMCINQASESSGFYWANPSTNPVTSDINSIPINRKPVGGLDVGSNLPSYNSASAESGWSWVNSNRNMNISMSDSNSGLGTAVTLGRPDNTTTGPIASPEGITPGTIAQPGGSAYILIDYDLGNYGGIPVDQPGVIWPTYLQYRENSSFTWEDATDIEGNVIKFGGAQANTYWRTSTGSSVIFGGSSLASDPPTAFYSTGIKDKLSAAITQEGSNESAPNPAKADSFESWMDAIEAAGNPQLISTGRKLFVIGRNQAYRDPSGNAPTDALDKFGEYRLITRYPYGNNISPRGSTVITNPRIPTLRIGSGSIPEAPYNLYTEAQQNQRVYLSFGDFYHPTQLSSNYYNGSGSNMTPPASFAYRVTAAQDSREEAASAGIDQTVYAREWGFKYVSQFYDDPQLTSAWSPGGVDKWYGYTGVNSGKLNVKYGNENSSTRNGPPIWTCPSCPGGSTTIIGQQMTQINSRWTAQFDNLGKKIIRTAEPCVGNIDPNTGGNNANDCTTSPANSYRFGSLAVVGGSNWIKIVGASFSSLFTPDILDGTCNLQGLWDRLTNSAPADGSATTMASVGNMTVKEPSCYEIIASANLSGGTARLINESSLGGQVFIRIDGPSLVGGSSAFKNYWWTIEGTFNGAPCVQ